MEKPKTIADKISPRRSVSVRFSLGLSQTICQRALEDVLSQAVGAHVLGNSGVVEPVFPGDPHPRKSVMFVVHVNEPPDSLIHFLRDTAGVVFVQDLSERRIYHKV